MPHKKTARRGYMDKHVLYPEKSRPKTIVIDDIDKFTKTRTIIPRLTQEEKNQLEKKLAIS